MNNEIAQAALVLIQDLFHEGCIIARPSGRSDDHSCRYCHNHANLTGNGFKTIHSSTCEWNRIVQLIDMIRELKKDE